MDRTGLFAKDPQVALGISFLIRNVGFVEAYESSWTDSAVRRLGKDLGVYVQDTLALSRGDITTANDGKRKRFLAQVSELEHRIEDLAKQDAIPPALPKGLGDALGARLGLPPGRELGEVMKALKARVEAGELPRNAAIEVYLPHASLPPTRMHPQEVTSESIPWPKDAIEKAL
jgi:predicted RecB family endonuclease